MSFDTSIQKCSTLQFTATCHRFQHTLRLLSVMLQQSDDFTLPIVEQPERSICLFDQPKTATQQCSRTKDQKYLAELLKTLDEIVILHELEEVQTHTFLYSERKQQAHFAICNDQWQQFLSASVESVFGIRVGYGQIQHPKLNMKVLHATKTKHDVMHLCRSLVCDACCCPCSLQLLEVYAPPGQLLGTIEQRCTFWMAAFDLKDSAGNVAIHINGTSRKMREFVISLSTGKAVAKITRKGSSKRVNSEAFILRFFTPLGDDVRLMLFAATLFIIPYILKCTLSLMLPCNPSTLEKLTWRDLLAHFIMIAYNVGKSRIQ